MRRWLFAAIGLVLGVAAIAALLRVDDAPLDDIDPASRAELERVLRESASGAGARNEP